jgi:hypothetical protein
MGGFGLMELCWSCVLLSSRCAFLVQRSCESVRQKDERNHRANRASDDRRNQKRNPLSHALGGHGNNGQNKRREKENEPEPKNPKGEEAKNQAYPTGFDSRRFRTNSVRNVGLPRISLR